MIISPSAISPYKIPTFQSGGGVPPFSFGNALQFDGVNDFVSFTPITFTTGTISFWFRTRDTNYNRVASADGATNFSYINPRVGFNTVLVRINSNNNQLFFNDPIFMVINTWYHLMITFNGTSSNLYVNGQASSSNPFAYVTAGQSFSMDRFGRLWATTNYSNFDLDEFGVISGVEGTSQNAIDLYNSGNGANFETVMGSSTAYWRCNEVDGATTLVDEQGTYNGTLTNFSTPPAYFIPH
jgi:hypothetical protein